VQHPRDGSIWEFSDRILEIKPQRDLGNGRLDMTNSLDSSSSDQSKQAEARPSRWLGVGVVAAASALVGGLAAAWWYRKTLSKLHEADGGPENPDFRISGEGSSYDI
jgi:hypothetical protein